MNLSTLRLSHPPSLAKGKSGVWAPRPRQIGAVLGPSLLLCLSACAAPPDDEGPVESDAMALSPAPAPPTLLRDVHLTENNTYTKPVIPPFRTSEDGRIAVDMKSHGASSRLYLLSPELLQGSMAPYGGRVTAPGADTGVHLVKAYLDVPSSTFYGQVNGTGAAATSRAICDGTPQFGYGATTALNPHPCGIESSPGVMKYPNDPVTGNATVDRARDCYSLTMISMVEYMDASNKKRVQPWGTPFTVAIANPKTTSATLAGSYFGAPVAGTAFYARQGDFGFMEPMVTRDGRLLVGRLEKTNRDPATGNNVTGNFDVVYSTYSESYNKCDVTRWSTLRPIAYANSDPLMQGRYGIAAHPLRDPHGNTITSDGTFTTGRDLEVSYPWIDRDGNNLFFTTMDETLFNTSSATRYPATDLAGNACATPLSGDCLTAATSETKKNFVGYGVAGLWTHGKMVLLDGPLNNIDFNLERGDAEQVMLDLYDAPNSAVRVGTGRANGSPAPGSGVAGSGNWTTENANFIDSLQQMFNYDEDLRPLTVRDVVWTMNSGKVSAEIAFDDYLDTNAMIVAEMTGALEHANLTGVNSTSRLHYYDGFHRAGGGVEGDWDLNTPEEIRFQNATTTLDWVVPTHGLAYGNVRMEPVALGGIEGKGAWLDGTGDGISFTVPAQTSKNVASYNWYLGLFIDPNFTDNNTVRELVGFPAGGGIGTVGLHAVVVRDAAGATETFNLATMPLSTAWSHLGFVFAPGRISLFVNGYRWEDRATALSIASFQPTAGTLRVGDIPNTQYSGFKGWIDELKLLAYEPGLEVACNHARGTLMAVNGVTNGGWENTAALYPAASHAAVRTALGVGGNTQYVCYHDYVEPIKASPDLAAIDEPLLSSVRTQLLFPESLAAAPAGLHFDVARPDSTANTFCLTCHSSPTSQLGLTMSALYAGTVGLQNDDRRQPMMPPRVIFGNVPAGYFYSTPFTGPATSISTIDHAIDRYAFP